MQCVACGAPLQPGVLPGLATPFVGRTPLLRLLDRELERVAQQHKGRFLLIEGERGIGKSRFVREWRAALLRQGTRPLSARALADRQGTPFWLVGELLADFFDIAGKGRAASRAAIEATLVALLGREVGMQSALPLFWLLELATVEERQEMEGLDAEARHKRLLHALRGLFLVAAGSQPLVLLVDDLPSVDGASIELFQQLLEKRARMPLLLVALARPEREESDRPARQLLAAIPPDSHFILEPLADPEALALLSGLLGWQALPPGLAEVLLPRAQGIPFLMEELTRTLIERGLLRRRQDRWRFDPRRGTTVSLLPLTVQATVSERLERLEEPARGLLGVAAIIGVQVEREVLGLAARRLGLSDEATADAIDLLVQRGFLLDEGALLRFRHNLTQEIVAHRLPESRRATVHGAVGEALAQLHVGRLAPVAERLVLHFAQGHDGGQALNYLAQLPALAAGHLAATQAATLFWLVHKRFPRELAARPELFLRYGDLLVAASRYDEAREIYTRGLDGARGEMASQLHGRIGVAYSHQARFGEAEERFTLALRGVPAGDGATRARLLSEMGWARYQQGQLDEAERLYEEALALFPYEAAEARAQVLNRMAGVAFRRGDLERAHKILTRGMDALFEAGDLAGMAKAHNNLGSIYTYQGDYDNGVLHRQQALQLFERLGDIEGQSSALLNMASLYSDLGRFKEAYPLARRALQLSRDSGQRHLECFALLLQGWIGTQKGEFETGRASLQESRAIAREIGAADYLFEGTLRLAELHLYEGASGEAAALMEELGRMEPLPNLSADLLRLRARLASQEGRHGEALRWIEMSLEQLANSQHQPYSRLLSQAEYIRYLLLANRRSDADAQRPRLKQTWQRINQGGIPPAHVLSRLEG